MQPDASPPKDDPLLGNRLSGLLDCALDDSLDPTKPVVVEVAEVPDHWEPPTPAHIAVLLPQYQIEHLIGRGGMGAVYKGRQITLNRPVAIKVLPAELARNKEFVGRFHREAQLLASLSHQGIVTIFDFGQTTEGHLYFVMEYVDGTDLNKLIHKQKKKLEPKEALSLTIQICEAMQFAHDNGVVHRDIKPANVLVTKDGRAKLADFGLAMKPADPAEIHAPPKPELYFSKASPNAAELRFTQPGAAMGTPGYAAPEVYEGKADERSDIYALGIMLYEMLTGAPPVGYFQLPSTMASVDHRVDLVVVKALEIDPDSRYQKAAEMRQDVVAATQPLSKPLPHAPQSQPRPPAQQQPAVSRSPSTKRIAPPAPRRSLVSRMAGLITLLCLAGAGYGAWRFVQTHPEWQRSIVSLHRQLTQSAEPEKTAKMEPAKPSTPPPPPVVTPATIAYAGDPVLGRWWWPGDHIVTFNADGTYTRTDGAKGLWVTDRAASLPREYTLRWEGVNVDRLTLDKEASILDGRIVNYRNALITAYRLPENLTPPPEPSTARLEDGFTMIFDRDHTSGWSHAGKGWLANRDGVLCTYTEPSVRDPWGMNWYASRRYSEFVLRLEFAVDSPATNSGVFLGLPALGSGALPLFPANSIEIEIRGPDTGGIGEPAKVWKLPFTARKWHTLEIAVIGNTITTQIDDNTVGSRVLDRKLDGYIGLQNLGCCGSAYFRNVRIKDLTAPPSPAKVSPPAAANALVRAAKSPPPNASALEVFAYDLNTLVTACVAAMDDRSHDAKRALLAGYRDGLLREGSTKSGAPLEAYRAAHNLCGQLLNVAAERAVASNRAEWNSRAAALRVALEPQVNAFRSKLATAGIAPP